MTSTVDVTVHSELLAVLAKNAAGCERAGEIAAENIDALCDAGMFALLAPRGRGGLEVTPAQFVGICAELGRGCPSSAWVVSIMNSCTWALARFPADVQAQVFDGAATPMVCGVMAPTGRCLDRGDHLEVTGRWMYASGCLHADWALLGVRTVDDDGNDVGRSIALVPVDQLTIERTWNAVGLSGTGSHTVRADAVAVPRTHVIGMDVASVGSLAPDVPELFRCSLVPILALALAGPLLGMAQGALDIFQRDYAPIRVGSASAAASLARGIDSIAAAGSVAVDAANQTQLWAADCRPMPPIDQVKVKLDIAEVARGTRAVVDVLLDLAGTPGLLTDSALARYWRDLAVGSRHGMLNHDRVTEEYGRLLLR